MTTERFLEVLDRHGPWVVILLLAILAVRVVWRDIVIPVRDQVLVLIKNWATLALDLGKRMETEAHEREIQATTLARIYEKVEEVQDTCERIVEQTAHLRQPRPTRRNPQPPASGSTGTSSGLTP